MHYKLGIHKSRHSELGIHELDIHELDIHKSRHSELGIRKLGIILLSPREGYVCS